MDDQTYEDEKPTSQPNSNEDDSGPAGPGERALGEETEPEPGGSSDYSPMLAGSSMGTSANNRTVNLALTYSNLQNLQTCVVTVTASPSDIFSWPQPGTTSITIPLTIGNDGLLRGNGTFILSSGKPTSATTVQFSWLKGTSPAITAVQLFASITVPGVSSS